MSDSAIPWTVARQAHLAVGFSRQEHWSGMPCPPPGDHLDPGMELIFLTSPALAGGFFTTSATWEAQHTVAVIKVWWQNKLLMPSCLNVKRGRREGGSGWGKHVNPWLIHVNVWQKPLQYCKVISFQLMGKKINVKRIIILWIMCVCVCVC